MSEMDDEDSAVLAGLEALCPKAPSTAASSRTASNYDGLPAKRDSHCEATNIIKKKKHKSGQRSRKSKRASQLKPPALPLTEPPVDDDEVSGSKRLSASSNMSSSGKVRRSSRKSHQSSKRASRAGMKPMGVTGGPRRDERRDSDISNPQWAQGASKNSGGESFVDKLKAAWLPILIGCGIFFLVFFIILIVVLTLPERFSCYPHDDRYFIEVIPNATINSVEPPLMCLEQGQKDATIVGETFLRWNIEDEEDALSMRFFIIIDEAANSTVALQQMSDVSGQGQYELVTNEDGDRTVLVGPTYASFLYTVQKCIDDESCDIELPANAVEVEITFDDSECNEGVEALSVCDEPEDVESTYELIWPPEDDRWSSVRANDALTCTTFSLVFPKTTSPVFSSPLVRYAHPELFLLQPNPDTPHATARTSSRDEENTMPPCQHSTFGELTLLPPPTLLDINPPVVCRPTSQLVVLSGHNIVQLRRESGDSVTEGTHTALPVQSSGDLMFNEDNMYTQSGGVVLKDSDVELQQCEALNVHRYELVESCDTSSITLHGSEHGTSTLNALFVRNPAPVDCVSTELVEFRVVEEPVLDHITPPLVCQHEGPQTITVYGSGLYNLDQQASVIRASEQELALVQENVCAALPLKRHVLTECESLDVSLPQSSNATSIQTIPIDARPSWTTDVLCLDSIDLTVIPPPVILSTLTAVKCNSTHFEVSLSGRFMMTVNGVHPSFTIDSQPIADTGVWGDCQTELSLTDTTFTAMECNSVLLVAPLPSSLHGTALRVQNPTPLNCEAVADFVIQLPVLIASPSAICVGIVAKTVTLTGATFDQQDGENVTLVMTSDDRQVTFERDVDQLTGACTTMGTVTTCDTIEFTVLQSDPQFTAGRWHIEPKRASAQQPCTVAAVFDLLTPPTLNVVEPSEVCLDVPNTFTLQGSFGQSTHALFQVQFRSTRDGKIRTPTAVVSTSPTEIVVSFGGSTLPDGLHDVILDGPSGCSTQLQSIVLVHPLLLAFFVSPSVVFSGINLQLTVFSSGLLEEAANVTFEHSTDALSTRVFGGAELTYPDTTLGEIQLVWFDSAVPGTYRVIVQSNIGCTAIANDAMRVTDARTVGLVSVVPGFALENTPTAITLKSGSQDIGGGMFATGAFLPAPLVYVNPRPALPGSLARLMRAVLVSSGGDELAAVVPDLPVTSGVSSNYDIIVVNTDESVGVLESGLVAMQDNPPRVDSLLPVIVSAGKAVQFVISGEFLPTDTADVQVSLHCSNDVTEQLTSIDLATSTEVRASFLALPGTIPAGVSCVLSLTETKVAMATSEIGTISVRNPSAKMTSSKRDAQTLNGARRGASVVVGRVTRAQSFLYVCGGDTNTGATIGGLLSDCESAPLSRFGEIGAFSVQRYGLKQAVSFASIEIVGRFLYLVGGADATGAVTTVQRAMMLSPQESPLIDVSISVFPDQNTTFAKGAWFYQVSAVFHINDDNNPGGESLPSEIRTMRLPYDIDGLEVIVTWDAIPLAVGYRVYRTQNADDNPNTVRLLAETIGNNATFYTDQGFASSYGANLVPLKLGSLGQWRVLSASSLSTTTFGARWAHSIAVTPTASANQYMLSVFGGWDGTTYTDSIDVLTVDVSAPTETGASETHMVGTWTASGATLADAKAFAGVNIVNAVTYDGFSGDSLQLLHVTGGPVSRSYEGFYRSGANKDQLTAVSNVVGKTCAQVQGGCFLVHGNAMMFFGDASNYPGSAVSSESFQFLKNGVSDETQVVVEASGASCSNSGADVAGLGAFRYAGCATAVGQFFMVGGVVGSGLSDQILTGAL